MNASIQIYVAIARWESMGRVKRLAPGQYRKVLRASKGASIAKKTAKRGRPKKTASTKERAISKKKPTSKKRAARSRNTTRKAAPKARPKKDRAKGSKPLHVEA